MVGTVASTKQKKTLRVEIERRFRHRKYGKIVRGRTICHVHDDAELASSGDLVEIEESAPKSRTKRWNLTRIVRRADEVAVENTASTSDDV
ncbi:MAG: 30S ribosomal protein S17 [Planctomycetaceae bacterium]